MPRSFPAGVPVRHTRPRSDGAGGGGPAVRDHARPLGLTASDLLATLPPRPLDHSTLLTTTCPARVRYRHSVTDITPMERAAGDLTEFELIEVIGKGGMGEVYIARQCSLTREIAIVPQCTPSTLAISPTRSPRSRASIARRCSSAAADVPGSTSTISSPCPMPSSPGSDMSMGKTSERWRRGRSSSWPVNCEKDRGEAGRNPIPILRRRESVPGAMKALEGVKANEVKEKLDAKNLGNRHLYLPSPSG